MHQATITATATGYLRAYARLQENAPDPNARDDIFIATFETLTWLEALVSRPEVEPLVEGDLSLAIGFVRGRVFHRWAEAIEFRTDVVHPQQLGMPREGMRRIEPAVVADWCWLSADALPGGKRSGTGKGEPEYRRLLDGNPARGALEVMVNVAAKALHKAGSPAS